MLNFKIWLAKEDADLSSVLKGATITLIGKDATKASAPKIVTQLVKDPNVKQASDKSLDPVAIDPKKLGSFVQNQIKTAIEQQKKDQKAAAMAGNA